MHIELETLAAGIPRKQALAWWWDFREGRHDHTFMTPSSRRTVRAMGEGEVWVRDRVAPLGVALFEEQLTARVDGYAVAFEGRNSFTSFSGAYSFQDDPRGTRVRLDAEVHLRPGLGWTKAVARPIVERILRRDLEGHVEHMVAELSR